ncbi:hypothetical protein MK139_01015 [bacterium]|nr:hypothetical protein [bacterium]
MDDRIPQYGLLIDLLLCRVCLADQQVRNSGRKARVGKGAMVDIRRAMERRLCTFFWRPSPAHHTQMIQRTVQHPSDPVRVHPYDVRGDGASRLTVGTLSATLEGGGTQDATTTDYLDCRASTL